MLNSSETLHSTEPRLTAVASGPESSLEGAGIFQLWKMRGELSSASPTTCRPSVHAPLQCSPIPGFSPHVGKRRPHSLDSAGTFSKAAVHPMQGLKSSGCCPRAPGDPKKGIPDGSGRVCRRGPV